ncbi:hypothetical protein [Cupriavidus pauculus]|uniref:hypothetical protein n=1 Tax=Cupriavidus pauculus TaxID=82633 RepID=UPI003857A1AC
MRPWNRAAYLAFIAATAIGVAGCSDDGPISNANLAALEAAKAEPDPQKAIELLRGQIAESVKASDDVCDVDWRAGRRGCLNLVRSEAQLEEALQARVIADVDNLPRNELLKAIGDLHYSEVQARIAKRVVLLAQEAEGTADDAPLLYSAGKIVAQGDLVMRNTDQAADLLARAWRAGSDSAASALADLYYGVHDVNNAYMWALRAKASVFAANRRQQLSPEAIAQAERAAKDDTLVSIGGR